MPAELTSSYTTENWLEASKGFKLLGYPEGEEGGQTLTRFVSKASPDNESASSRNDFEQALKKVSRRTKK